MSYYSFRIGHVLHVSPEQMWELTPSDMVGALAIFEAMYPSG